MKRFAVIGSPISHSLSPRLHRAWFAHRGVEATYEAIEVGSGELAGVLVESNEFSGFSVTMPLKSEAAALAQTGDDVVQRIGVANTLVSSDSGWSAFNTDVLGFRDLLAHTPLAASDSVLILGAGGTARAALAALEGSGAASLVMARLGSNTDALARLFPEVTIIPWDPDSHHLNSKIVISTTPRGATDDLIGGTGTLIDVLYADWPTPLAKSWRGPVIDGLELLVRQATHQIGLFWPEDHIDLGECYRVLSDAARSR